MKKILFMVILLMITGLLMAENVVLMNEAFSGSSAPNGWTVVNAGAGNNWIFSTSGGNYGDCMKYNYNQANQANAWAFTIGLALEANAQYEIKFDQIVQSANYPERMKVTIGNAQTVASQTTTLWNNNNLSNDSYLTHSINYTPTTTGTFYLAFNCYSERNMYALFIDNVKVTKLDNTALPTATTLLTPANNALNLPLNQQLTWNPAGSGPTGYKILFGTTNPPTTLTTLGNVTTWNPSPALQYNTTYYWSVTPFNTNGDAPATPVWSFTTMSDPTMPIPYLQDFNASASLPANWTSNMLISPLHGNNSSNGAYRNLQQTVETAFITSCPIGILATTSELLFDYRIVNFTSYPNVGTAITSDKIEVQISTNNGSSFTTIHTINNTNHVTSSSFASKSINLNACAGQTVMIKLLATYSTGDYFVDFDNIQVREVLNTPVYFANPSEYNYGDLQTGTQSSAQTFSIKNNGGGNLTINSVSITGANADQFSLTDTNGYSLNLIADQTMTFSVKFTPTTAGSKSANISINYNNGTTQTGTIALSGYSIDSVISTFPHTQNFTNFMPLLWSYKEGLLANPSTLSEATSSWEADGFANFGSTGAARLNIYGDSRKSWLISPEINLGSVSGGYKLEFDLALTAWNATTVASTAGFDDKFAVVISTDNGTTWTSANTLRLWDNVSSSNVFNDISNTLDHVTINLLGYSGLVKIAFYGESTLFNASNDLFIDNFKISYDATLPVELSAFTTALIANNTVSLSWTTQSENNLRGYLIHRSSSNQIASALCISSIIQATNTSTETNYSYTDSETSPTTTYYYWLQSVENDGSSTFYGPYSIRTNDNTTTPILPNVTKLNTAYPNPFNSATLANIKADVKDGEVATLSIYNVKGQTVKIYKNLIPGEHSLTWNGKDDSNNRCAAGIYFYKLSSPTYSSVKKIMYLK